jgi:Mrp family chromosome partitioning ATPase
MAMVSFGAEVIADGNIHVYAPLRGRRLPARAATPMPASLRLPGAAADLHRRHLPHHRERTCPPEVLGQATQVRLEGTRGRAGDRAAFILIPGPATVWRTPIHKETSAHMAKIVVVTSGKGGVGKTTTSASFASGLALRGHKTAVIDFDVGLRNLDLIMGCERRVVYDLINVIHGEANLNQALIKDKQCDNLFVLAASQTRDKDALTQEGVEKVLKDLAAMGFEYIVCDSPAGIETGALMAMHFADEALVVTNPEVSSVRDSDRILGMLGSKTKRAIEGREPDQGAPAHHALQPQPRAGRPDAVAGGHPGHPAHQADRRDPESRERCCRRPTRACPPSTCRAAMCPRPTRT